MGRKKKEEPVEVKDPVEATVLALEKQFGKGIIASGHGTRMTDVECYPFDIPGVNNILSGKYNGGLPKGRIIEVYGPESSGKTTLALHFTAAMQKAGLRTAFVDAEHALDLNYAEKLGVDTEGLLISQPDTGEQALEVVEALVRSGGIKLIVVDSVAALVPRAEIEGDMGDSHMGLQARLMSQAMRKLAGLVSKSGCTVIFINQLRMKIGVMFGSPETTTGGNALKFYASIRIDVRRIGAVKDSAGNVTAARTRVKVVKNKIAPPFREVELDLVYGRGFDRMANLLELGTDIGVIDKSGAWYSYQGEQIGQGAAKAAAVLTQNTELQERITAALEAY